MRKVELFYKKQFTGFGVVYFFASSIYGMLQGVFYGIWLDGSGVLVFISRGGKKIGGR